MINLSKIYTGYAYLSIQSRFDHLHLCSP